MSRRARAAVARPAGGDRTFTTLAGLVLLALGVLVVLLGAGVFGVNRARRPLLDPMVVSWITGHVAVFRVIAIVGGILLAILGLVGALRSVRPEPRSDVLLSERPGERLVVEHAAFCDAVTADAEQIAGVTRVRARLVGDRRRPALRLSLWLEDGTDVRDVWAEIDGRVLARARRAFGVSALPTAVRLELEAAAPAAPPRVS